MKKLAILLLSVFTVVTAFACGCNDKKAYTLDSNIEPESVKIETTEEEPDAEDQNSVQQGAKCPDGECPHPRRPHKKHHKRLPRPKPAYKKRN